MINIFIILIVYYTDQGKLDSQRKFVIGRHLGYTSCVKDS